MAVFKPFCAMRFTPQAGSMDELACPPYDIISEEERKAYLEQNPCNIIRLELPREGENPYLEAGRLLDQWLEEKILACDDQPGYYIYEEEFTVGGQKKKIKGLVGLVQLEPWEKGVVLPHEETLSKAKEDRFELMKACGCNFSSVYSLYFDADRQVSRQIDRYSAGPALMEFKTPDGIVHKVWKIDQPQGMDSIESAFRDKKLYIADGHHRYETALNYKKLREGNPASHYAMMTVVNMENEGLVVFPTHRVLHGLKDFNAAALLDGCRKYFDIEDASHHQLLPRMQQLGEAGKKAFGFYSGGIAKVLALKEEDAMQKLMPHASEALRGLDVNILHTLVLEQLLGIDKENLKNQTNLIYTRDPHEAVEMVDQEKADCAFFLNPTKVGEIAAVASAGEKMPQKSTYFYPKLITGHLMNRIGKD